MLKAENLILHVEDNGAKKCLLDHISFQVDDGEMLVITGPNGGGKSTLAKVLTQMKLEFGREIKTDRIILHTRADFPHDNWWVNATVEFSDGTSMLLDLKKTDVSQEFTFEEKTISWLVLKDLIKADDPSPFPALTQIEVFGIEC